jgi:hypothetical protein
MKKSSKKTKPGFPIIELSLIAFMIFIFGLTTAQVLKGSQEHYYVYPIIIAGLTFGYYFSNYRNKTIQKLGANLIVKPLFGKRKFLNRNNTKGYEIYETYDYTGLIKQIRIIDLKENKIIFAKDSYSDYEKVIRLIKSSGIEYLGTKEIKWRFKKQYATISIIIFVLAMMFFMFLRMI